MVFAIFCVKCVAVFCWYFVLILQLTQLSRSVPCSRAMYLFSSIDNAMI